MRECVGAIIVRQESVLLGKRSANRTFYPKSGTCSGDTLNLASHHGRRWNVNSQRSLELFSPTLIT